MILGFAHLAVNSDNLQLSEAEWRAHGYTRTALYQQVPNHPFKRAFCNNYVPTHDLMLLNGPSPCPTLELTYHGPTQGINRQLGWSNKGIYVRVADTDSFCRLCVTGLGFQIDKKNELRWVSHLSNWSCCMHTEIGEVEPVRLDAVGPTCLAFYSNRIEEDICRLCDLGASDCGGTFELMLGDKYMDIAMLRAPGGVLLELINPKAREQ